MYAEEAAGCYYRVKYELNDTKAARNIEKAARRLRREIPFTKAQFETMFSAMHPKACAALLAAGRGGADTAGRRRVRPDAKNREASAERRT